MRSMKGVVEGQCGESNALVGLAQGFASSNQRVTPSATANLTGLLPSSSRGEAFANEFLNEIAHKTAAPRTFDMKAMMGSLPSRTIPLLPQSGAMAAAWSNEFTQSRASQHPLAAQWSQQYLSSSSRPAYDSAWTQAQSSSTSSALAPSGSLQSSSSSSMDMMWSSEYLDNFDSSSTMKGNELADSWVNEFMSEDYWNKTMESAWDDAKWTAPQNFMPTTEETSTYHPQEENPFVGQEGLLARGDEFVNQGDLGNSILCYEAAVQQNPGDAQAWCRLGLSHAENEVDVKAIAAFRKCLEIEPTNKEALLALSVSLANESMENEALAQLEKWITAHEGGDVRALVQRPHGSFLDHAWFEKVEERFLSVAQRQEGPPDANLQNALGVLYNLNRNFDRAVDSIRLAISARPQDARLWNRLGATLANGDRTAEAVAAYREALRLFPHYVRARYNLGITCMHLSSYKEAIEHFVSALELQKGNREGSSIWTTLRSATLRSMSGDTEALLRAIDARDLNGFKEMLHASHFAS